MRSWSRCESLLSDERLSVEIIHINIIDWRRFGRLDQMAIPNIAARVANLFLDRIFAGRLPPTYLIAASFLRSMRLIQSCNSLGSWFCNSIWTK